MRRGAHYFYPEYTQKGILIVKRGETAPDMTIVALNFTSEDVIVPFTYPAHGSWNDALVAGAATPPVPRAQISISGNHGRVLLLS